MEEQKRSSMILFLSKYSDKAQKDTYFYDETKGGFEGEQTNDAPVKRLIQIAKENHNPIDTIICIVSQEVFTERKAPGNQTAFERFKDMVLKHCSAIYGDDYKTKIKILPIGYDFEVPTKFEKGEKYDGDGSDLKSLPESKERSVNIYRKIEEKLGLNVSSENKVEHSIYIDYTGGLRDSNFFMVALIRYLEFKDIECKDIVYSDFFSKPKEIRNIRYIYDMFDMINGVSEFVGTGNARQLIKLQENLKAPNSNGIDKSKAKDFVDSLQSFSDAIALCRVDDIEKSIEEITDNIKNLEDDTTQDIFVQMFKTLIPTVKEKLYIDKASPSILDLAQWCLENNMLQQAVTIYNEKILDYYHNNWEVFGGVLHWFLRKNDPCNCKSNEILEKFNNLLYKKSIIEYILSDVLACTTNISARDIDQRVAKHIKTDFEACRAISSEYINGTLPHKINQNGTSVLVLQKDFYRFIQALKNGDYNAKRYLANKIKNLGTNEPEFNLKALEILEKEATRHKEYNDLFKAMKFYHAIRVIRNNLNHASGNMTTSQGMIAYLEKQGLEGVDPDKGQPFKIKLTKGFISNSLQCAIDCSREVCKKPNTP
ncbi:TM1812 family CRISPR-associated protein [Filifactor villosus]|uniref:TM1812 family CRISPR-associated protein n=1 Tax=Filifactor villosus TaxID=29374 RepID=A0ABV9QKF8_9FIRM